jgi:hypothetical protein
VAEGDLVARAGSSGDPEHDQPYVHLGIRRTAEKHGYLDPMALLPPRAAAGSPAGPAVDPEPEPAPAPAAEPVSTPAVPAAAPVAAGPAAEAVPVASAHVEPAPAAVAAPLARVATRPRVASPSTGSPGSRGTPTEVAAPGHAQAQTTERPTGNSLRRVRLESRRRTRVENGRPRPRAEQPTAPAGRRLRQARPVVTTTLAAREAPAAFVRRPHVLTPREPSSQGVSSEPPSATPWGLVLAAVAAVLAGACGLGRARRTPAPAEGPPVDLSPTRACPVGRRPRRARLCGSRRSTPCSGARATSRRAGCTPLPVRAGRLRRPVTGRGETVLS